MNRLECVIRVKGEEKEVKKVAEIRGTGKDYLTSLSSSICQMQGEVNTFLTQLVEKEKMDSHEASVTQGAGSADEGFLI